MVIHDNPDYNLVEFSAPKQVKKFGNREYVAYGYTYKKGLAEDKAAAVRRLNMSARVTHETGMDILWIGKKGAPRSVSGRSPLTVKRFKVTKSRFIDRWKVNGGWIAGKFYSEVHIMDRNEARSIADARNRLIAKKAGNTRKIRQGRRKEA